MIKLNTHVIKQISVLPGVTIPIVVHILINIDIKIVSLDIRGSLIIMKNGQLTKIRSKKKRRSYRLIDV